MAKDLRYLAGRMEEIADNISDAVNLITQDTAIAAVAAISAGTPVDVATARSNWFASLGSPVYGVRKAFSPFASRWRPVPGMFPGGPIGETRNQAGTVWAATAAIKPRKAGQDIYITNTLPYIGRLNDGYSKQAPAGFVQRGISKATSQFETIARNRLSKI